MGLFELLFFGYSALLGTSLCGMGLYNILYERKKRKLGYVNKKRSMLVNSLLSMTKEDTVPLLMTLVPVVNLAWWGSVLTFKKTSEADMSDEIEKNDITTVEWAKHLLDMSDEKDNKMALRVLKVRKAQIKNERYLSKKKREYDGIREQIESTYRDLALPEKVVAVRKLQNKSNAIDRVTPFSDYTPDEKIALLLAELEHAYQEKARLEGTDVEEEVKLLLDGEKLKK